MSGSEVAEPILNSPFGEPESHWFIREGSMPERRRGRRPAFYYYRPPRTGAEDDADADVGTAIELKLVNRIRERLQQWREARWPGTTRTTRELLEYWRRDGRQQRLFFAQLEAAETIVFLTEARGDLLQGIAIPTDEPSEERKADGFTSFRRYACKMATGAGKTTVMGMLAAWSILNKVESRSDARFSDVVLVVCPNVTIRNRLSELDPRHGEASLYRTRDLVPPHLMARLTDGKVLVRNWHVFAPQTPQVDDTSARVIRAGVESTRSETILIGAKTTTARGRRYLTLEELQVQEAAGLLRIVERKLEKDGSLNAVRVVSTRYIESDTALVNRVLGSDVGAKKNVLVFNDEAHHAYRIRKPEPDPDEEDTLGEEGEAEDFYQEATIWVEGLDRVHKLRSINFCVDLSATPYFLGRVGQDTNRPFPWVVSDFGLTDAIESGLTKIPQLVVRDSTGAEVPGYFNIWQWVLKRLSPAERGGKKATPKPEAVLKWANPPIAMLAGLWEELRREWEQSKGDPRPPVFILVCKNTKLAKLVFEWLGEDKPPPGVPSAKIEGFLNRESRQHTIRVDSKVVHETDTGEAKSKETEWMRRTLDTVGKLDWPRDRVGRPIYPEDFEELARQLGRPLHPPGRDVRCIVSVGMLTEGWDCNTVTHIVGLRPFMSQLLCEQVVGRGLRRRDYDLRADGKLSEEIAKVFGVPFAIVPFKETKGTKPQPVRRWHVHALPEKASYEIRFPRVEGYQQAVRNRLAVDWDVIAKTVVDPTQIPHAADLKAALPSASGRPSVNGPGDLERVDLNPFLRGRRLQELVFDLARDLTRVYAAQPSCDVPPQALFPQMMHFAQHYLREKVEVLGGAKLLAVFLSPYYGMVVERLLASIRPDERAGEAPEVPRLETSRGAGSTQDVEFWTSREVYPVVKSHVNYVVADTAKWEQSAAFLLDGHPLVEAFVKNTGLGFAIPYLRDGEPHDYVPDFIVRLRTEPALHLILEVKGFDPLTDVKLQAAERWVRAVNAGHSHGRWDYALTKTVADIGKQIEGVVKGASSGSR